MNGRVALGAFSIAAAIALVGCSLEQTGTAPDDPLGDASPIDEGTLDTGVEDSTSDTSDPDTTPPGDSEPPPDTTVPPDTTPPPDTTVPLDTTPPPDTTPPLDTTPPPDTSCSEVTCGALTGGFKRVGLVDRTVSCPPGFVATDVVEGRDGNGCACSCSKGSDPTCPGSGAISLTSGTSSTCGGAVTNATSPGSGSCGTFGSTFSMPSHVKGTVPAATGGTCTVSVTPDKSAISRPRRLCEPGSSACTGDICKTPFVECVEVPSATTPCPGSYPNFRPVGADVTLTCPSCTCGVTATCTGEITFYANGSCGGGNVKVSLDNVCNAVGTGAPASSNSFKYDPLSPTGVACTTSYAAQPGTRTFVGQRNLCCR